MRIILVIVFTGIFYSGCSQKSPYQKFVDSFMTKSSNELIDFRATFYKGDEISKGDAIEFVYDNDSSKLYCKEEIFNMETEKVEGYSTNLYLPKKLFKIKTNDYIIIAYSKHVCPNLKMHDVTEARVLLKILNQKYEAMDTLTVFREKYDFLRRSILNPNTSKIFLISSEETGVGMEAFLIRINQKTLKFEIEKSQKNAQNMSDNLEKNIEILGWSEAFRIN